MSATAVQSWARASEADKAENGSTYRSTYFLAGPFPDNSAQGYIMVATEEYVKVRYPGVEITDQEFMDPARAAQVFGSDRPYNTWAMRITWKKNSGGTPLAFFSGPAGLITLGIIAAIVIIIGIVITARIVEKLVQIAPPLKDLLSPATVIAIIVIVALVAGAIKKGGP
jgi:hypothetical protein